MQGPGMPSIPAEPDTSRMRDMHGPQFDQVFLQTMIDHDEDTVAMTSREQEYGTNPTMQQLAQEIQTRQLAEITQMRRMLASPSPATS